MPSIQVTQAINSALEGRATTLENLVLEMQEELTHLKDCLEVQKRTMVVAVKALRTEFMEETEKGPGRKRKKKVMKKNARRQRKLPPPLPMNPTVQERHFHQPTASSYKKHVCPVDGKVQQSWELLPLTRWVGPPISLLYEIFRFLICLFLAMVICHPRLRLTK